MVTNTFPLIQKYLIIICCSCVLAACGGGGGSTNVGAAVVGASTGGGSGSSSSNNTPAPQITSFTVTPTSAKVNEYVTLTWATTDATSCTANVDWQGSKDTSGTEEFKVTQEKQYQFRLTCDGNGQVVASVYVDVDDPYTEGSCTTPHSTAFPERYMGPLDIPYPSNTLPNHWLRDMGLKDFSLEWVYDNYSRHSSSWAENCTKEEYVKLHYRMTIMELAETGANSLTIYNFGYWENANADLWVLEDAWWHISKKTIEYIVKTAHDYGVEVHYVWQFMPLDKYDRWLFPFSQGARVDHALIDRMWDAHENLMLETAEWGEQIGIDALSVDWSAMWICFCGVDGEIPNDSQAQVELRDHWMTRVSEAIDVIRSKFSGEIWIGDGPIWNDWRVLEKVDIIQKSFGGFIRDAEENKSMTVELIRDRLLEDMERSYNNFFGHDGQKPKGSYSTSQDVPVVFQIVSQSTEFFPYRGWMEDGFCTPGTIEGYSDPKCVQLPVTREAIDFSRQAVFYEGVLQAISLQTSWTIAGIQPSCSYWLTPSLQRASQEKDIPSVREGFPEISQSIRGKPAENILKYWWTGVHDQYDPVFSD